MIFGPPAFDKQGELGSTFKECVFFPKPYSDDVKENQGEGKNSHRVMPKTIKHGGLGSYLHRKEPVSVQETFPPPKVRRCS
jgi:hypothetical protein